VVAPLGRRDYLRGFKENVILGHLIPAGTGFPMYRNIKLVPLGEPIAVEELLGDRLQTAAPDAAMLASAIPEEDIES